MSRIEKLREFLKETPGDSFLQHALALEYIKEGNDQEARSLFRNILEKEPSYVGSYYHLGKLLERAMDFNAAIGVYKKGMEEAQRAGDHHSRMELQAALEDIEE